MVYISVDVILCMCKTIAAVMFFWFHAVRCMMYGFGDDQNPYSESVDLLEDLVIEYISEMVNSIHYHQIL